MRHIILFTAALLVGCSEGSAPLDTRPAHEEIRLAPLSSEVAADPALRARAAQDAFGAFVLVSQAADKAVTWNEAVALVDAAVASSDVSEPVLQEVAAATLLSRFLLPATTTDMKREAIRRADVLLRAGSPERALVKRAVEDGRDVMSEPQRMFYDLWVAGPARETMIRELGDAAASSPSEGDTTTPAFPGRLGSVLSDED